MHILVHPFLLYIFAVSHIIRIFAPTNAIIIPNYTIL